MAPRCPSNPASIPEEILGSGRELLADSEEREGFIPDTEYTPCTGEEIVGKRTGFTASAVEQRRPKVKAG